MQTLDTTQFKELGQIAKDRGTNVQTVIRAIVIPEWTNQQAMKRHFAKFGPKNPGDVDMVMTSPPYFGIRNYGDKPESILGTVKQVKSRPWHAKQRHHRRRSSKN